MARVALGLPVEARDAPELAEEEAKAVEENEEHKEPVE